MLKENFKTSFLLNLRTTRHCVALMPRARQWLVWQQDKHKDLGRRADRGLRAVVFADDPREWIRGPRDVPWSQVSAEYDDATRQMNKSTDGKKKQKTAPITCSQSQTVSAERKTRQENLLLFLATSSFPT